MAPALPTQSDLENMFGVDNIRLWADVNNDNATQSIEDRIDWAFNEARIYISGRLAVKYDISIFVTYPEAVFSLICKRAGIELYSRPRGLVDGDAAAAVIAATSLEVETRLEQILADQFRLIDLPSETVGMPGVNNSGGARSLNHNVHEQIYGEPIVCDWTNFYRG